MCSEIDVDNGLDCGDCEACAPKEQQEAKKAAQGYVKQAQCDQALLEGIKEAVLDVEQSLTLFWRRLRAVLLSFDYDIGKDDEL